MTAVLAAPAQPPAPGRPVSPWWVRSALAALLLGAVALLAVAALRVAAGTARFEPVTPVFGGTAQAVTLPTYGPQGMHVVGYDHGAMVRLTLPVTNAGRLPVTVIAVGLGGGVAPLLEVRAVRGLPVSLGPGETGQVELTAELVNCRFFHEREVQNYAGVDVGFTVLGQAGTGTVSFDRPILVHSPMIVGCPDRLLDRQAHDRSDLTGAA